MSAYPRFSALCATLFQHYPPYQLQNAYPPSTFVLYSSPSVIFQTALFNPPPIPCHAYLDTLTYEVSLFHYIFDCYIPSFDDFVVFMLLRRQLFDSVCQAANCSALLQSGRQCPSKRLLMQLLVCIPISSLLFGLMTKEKIAQCSPHA